MNGRLKTRALQPDPMAEKMLDPLSAGFLQNIFIDNAALQKLAQKNP